MTQIVHCMWICQFLLSIPKHFKFRVKILAVWRINCT